MTKKAKTLNGIVAKAIIITGLSLVGICYGKEIINWMEDGLDEIQTSLQREILIDYLQNMTSGYQ
jgi:hypothetical protein